MITIPYQRIYELIAPFFPDDWQRTVLFMEYGESSYTMKFYIKDQSGNYLDCFDLPYASEDDVMNAFEEIDQLVYPARAQLNEKDKWTLMTMVILSSGKFHVDFCYDDLSENYMSFLKQWKAQYLI